MLTNVNFDEHRYAVSLLQGYQVLSHYLKSKKRKRRKSLKIESLKILNIYPLHVIGLDHVDLGSKLYLKFTITFLFMGNFH